MNIIISGYGRMGKEVEKEAVSRGHAVVDKIDRENEWKRIKPTSQAEVVIDFSLPEVVVSNLFRCFEIGIPVVTGTTGWYDQLDEITKACAEKSGTLFYAPNFSIGVNVFFHMNKKLAAILSSFPEYQARIEEIHHIHKLDAPSGTAIKLAHDILIQHDSYERWISGHDAKDGELPLVSAREGEVPGTHVVKYGSSADFIEIRHEALNRTGFAKGAITASEWVVDKKGVYTMDDLLAAVL
jgi:4-hydroxy-tetrahydrodipicolinate reductase